MLRHPAERLGLECIQTIGISGESTHIHLASFRAYLERLGIACVCEFYLRSVFPHNRGIPFKRCSGAFVDTIPSCHIDIIPGDTDRLDLSVNRLRRIHKRLSLSVLPKRRNKIAVCIRGASSDIDIIPTEGYVKCFCSLVRVCAEIRRAVVSARPSESRAKLVIIAGDINHGGLDHSHLAGGGLVASACSYGGGSFRHRCDHSLRVDRRHRCIVSFPSDF